MRDLSPSEVAALRQIAQDRPIRYRYSPRGATGTVLPSQVAILEARGLVDYRPRTERHTITQDGRDLLARLDQGATR